MAHATKPVALSCQEPKQSDIFIPVDFSTRPYPSLLPAVFSSCPVTEPRAWTLSDIGRVGRWCDI